jgi:hypothetical protein
MKLRPSALAGIPANPWLTNTALLLFGLLILEFCRAGVGEFHHYTYGLSSDIFSQLILFLGAISLIERSPTNKFTLPLIFAIALSARLICVYHPAFLSTDVYRYVWDGKVQAAGINPFRYIPADSHLAFLRDNAIYPNINRRDYAHTIYPPGAQALFLLITRIRATEPFMKLAMVAFEAATCVVLMKIMKQLNQPRERILLYAWNPLCFWEIASSGHADAAALTCIALALYAHQRRKSTATGLWLGLATLVKIYPLALLPAFLTLPFRPALPFRKDQWRIVLTAIATILIGYACYASVGMGVFGFLPDYAKEEGLETGRRYFPLNFVNRFLHTNIPSAAYIVFCGLVMLSLCLWALRRARLSTNQPQAAIFSVTVIATVLNLCYAPHYPWYFLWILPSLTLHPWRPAFYLVTAATFLFATPLGAYGEPMFLLNKLLYGGFFLFLAYDLLVHFVQAGKRVPHPCTARVGFNYSQPELTPARDL